MAHTQERFILYNCIKFEADSSIRSKVIKGSYHFEIGSRDSGHAYLGVILRFVRRKGPSSISVPNLKQIHHFIQSYKGPKFSTLGHVTQVRPVRGRFMVHMQEGSVLYVCTKFEAESSIRSKVITASQNFEIGLHDPGHAHFGVI